MYQKVKGCFSYSFKWHGKRVNPFDLIHSACQKHVLLAEIDDCIILLEQVSVTDGLIPELIHDLAFKTCKAHLALRKETRGILPE